MRKNVWKLVMRAGPLLLLFLAATSMSAYAFLGFGNSASWKEEVLLHDGRKIVVERSQTHGGRHEVGQPAPVKEHTITFTLPGSKKVVVWKNEFSPEIGKSNFYELALHILNDTPYVVASPHGCLAYNKWGRPNPPYVFFKYDGNTWQCIPLAEFPAEFKNINLAISTLADEKKLVKQKLVPAEMVKKLNSEATQPEYKTIIRTPLVTGKNSASDVDCPDYSSPQYTSPKAPFPISPSDKKNDEK